MVVKEEKEVRPLELVMPETEVMVVRPEMSTSGDSQETEATVVKVVTQWAVVKPATVDLAVEVVMPSRVGTLVTPETVVMVATS